MSLPVSELKRRSKSTLTINPDTHQAAAISVLAANPDEAFTPTEIEARTDIPTGSAAKVLSRLVDKGATVNLEGHYFVNKDKLDDIRLVLVDEHQRQMMRKMARAETSAVADPERNKSGDLVSDEAVEEELADLEEAATSEEI